MSSRDAEREREIEGSGDVAALKRLRSSRKGQITKVERDVEKYSSSTISNLKKPALEATLTTLDYQLYFYEESSFCYEKAETIPKMPSTRDGKRWRMKRQQVMQRSPLPRTSDYSYKSTFAPSTLSTRSGGSSTNSRLCPTQIALETVIWQNSSRPLEG